MSKNFRLCINDLHTNCIKWEKLFIKKMGEAKRREELGIPPREKKIDKKLSKNKLNKILNKYPFLPYILGVSLLSILIIDLFNYYK